MSGPPADTVPRPSPATGGEAAPAPSSSSAAAAPRSPAVAASDVTPPSPPAPPASAAPSSAPTPPSAPVSQLPPTTAGADPPAPPGPPAQEIPLLSESRFARYFFLAFASLVVAAFGAIIWPFVKVIFIAFVLFILGKPLYGLLRRRLRGRQAVASFLTCITLMVIVFLPLVFLSALLAGHALDFYRYINDELASGNLKKYLDLRNSRPVVAVSRYIPAVKDIDLQGAEVVGQVLGTVSQFVYSKATAVLKGISTVLAGFVLVLFVTFYLFIDGDRLMQELKKLSPLDDQHDQEILDELTSTIKVTFKGSLVIALVQGVLGAVGFLICGIRSWVLWGAVMSVASFIPVVGTALIWVPAAIYLAATHHIWAAVFLALWGAIPLGLSDNVIRTYVVKGGGNVHPLLIFFSVMGGIGAFGFLGIVLGPLILSLLVYVIRVYQRFLAHRQT